MCISERLRQVCEAKNWKITDFAEQAGIAYRTIQGYIGEIGRASCRERVLCSV